MVELILGPTTARSTHQCDGCVYLGDSHTDRVALRVQSGGVSSRHFNVVSDTRVIALVRMIGRALGGGGRGLIGLALIGQVMQSGEIIFDFLVCSQSGLAIRGG